LWLVIDIQTGGQTYVPGRQDFTLVPTACGDELLSERFNFLRTLNALGAATPMRKKISRKVDTALEWHLLFCRWLKAWGVGHNGISSGLSR
jgi:hypothetical protein